MATASIGACVGERPPVPATPEPEPELEPESELELEPEPEVAVETREFEQIFGSEETLAPLSEGQINYLEQALVEVEQAPPQRRATAALTSLMLAARGRIPPQLAEDLLEYNRADAARRAVMLSTAIQNNLWLFDEVCGRSFATVTESSLDLRSRAEVSRHVWRECRLDRYPLLEGEADYVEVSGRVGLEPMIAYFIYGYLDEHGGAHPLEARLLRAIARA